MPASGGLLGFFGDLLWVMVLVTFGLACVNEIWFGIYLSVPCPCRSLSLIVDIMVVLPAAELLRWRNVDFPVCLFTVGGCFLF